MSLWLALLLSAAPPTDPDVAAAATAVDEGRFEAVLPALARARTHPLSPDEQLTGYELEAFTAAAFDDLAAERQAFAALLELKPDYALPRRAGPKMQEVFLEVRAARRAAAPNPQAEVTPDTSPSRLHVAAVALVQVTAPRAVGADVSATFRTFSVLDLGLGLAIGRTLGAELVADLHLPVSWRVRPFLQLRGLAFFSPGAVAWGGAAWLGGSLELGTGRALVGLGGELYRAPAGFASQSLLVLVGYALDPGAL